MNGIFGDSELGKIPFDSEHGTAKIVRLADGDTMQSNLHTKMTTRYVMKYKAGILPKEILSGFER